MKALICLMLLASAAAAEGRIPIAYISTQGDEAYGQCSQGADCWYDLHESKKWQPLYAGGSVIILLVGSAYAAYVTVGVLSGGSGRKMIKP
jgi:hypothetical protein